MLLLARRGEYGPGDPVALANARVEQITAGVPTRLERALKPGTRLRGAPFGGR